mmetsp:Transcript_32774/g.65233  ORF Transcript_32774/g.65233 Transcript_32774/m.65233 type:complete len:81 (-) Transcript_32774:1051-1293(-)
MECAHTPPSSGVRAGIHTYMLRLVCTSLLITIKPINPFHLLLCVAASLKLLLPKIDEHTAKHTNANPKPHKHPNTGKHIH